MTFLKNIYHVIRREAEMFGEHRTFSMLSVGLPIIAFLFFLVLFRAGVPHDMPIAILDEDNTPLSRKLAHMIDATPSAKVAYNVVDMAEAERMIKQGKIDAVVVLPKDMERDIYRNKQANVVAYINGVNVTKNGLLDKDIRTVLYTYSSGIQIQTLMKKGISEREAYDMMMPIYFEKHVLFNPYINYAYYLLPIFLSMMLLIFVLLTTIFTFGVELKASKANEWLETAGGNIIAAVTGKLLPYTVIFTVLGILINTLLYNFVGLPLNGDKHLLLISTLVFVMAYQAIGVFIVSILGNLRLSLSIGGGYSVLAFTFSGLTFPLAAMSTTMNIVSYAFPLTYYIEIFIDQAMRGAPIAVSMPHLGFMLLFILLPIPLITRLKRMCQDSSYWGKL